MGDYCFCVLKGEKAFRLGKNILTESKAKRHFELPEALMQKLSEKEETSELIALVNMREDDLGRIKARKNLLVVVFDRPASPGNLGTIIRTCDAFKVDGLIVTGHAADVYDPKTIRASVGTLFSMPVIRIPSHKELLPWFEQLRGELGGVQIIGTSAKGTKDVAEQDFTTPTILLLGNETLGLSMQYKELADALVKIPVHGTASSLNVASAASIVLYEIQQQRMNHE